MKAERPQLHIMRPHEAAITGISLHATGDYLLSVSEDEKWAFSDVRSGRILCRVSDPASAQGGHNNHCIILKRKLCIVHKSTSLK